MTSYYCHGEAKVKCILMVVSGVYNRFCLLQIKCDINEKHRFGIMRYIKQFPNYGLYGFEK